MEVLEVASAAAAAFLSRDDLHLFSEGTATRDVLAIVCSFTPVMRRNYRIGVPADGRWRELLNSDAIHFGGSGQGNFGGVDAIPFQGHGHSHSMLLTLPPLAMVCFKHDGSP